jgi:hypothetical protein
MDLTKWLKLNSVEPTPLVLKQNQCVLEYDALCAECNKLPTDQMLCSGFRPYFDLEDSEYYGVPIFGNAACPKLVDLQVRSHLDNRLKNSFLTKTVVQEAISEYGADYFVFEIKEDEILVNEIAFPKMTQAPASIEVSQVLQVIIVGAIFNGYTAKRMYPQQIMVNAQSEDDLYNNFVLTTDWLVVERLDLLIGRHYEKERMREVIRQRIVQGLPTVVTMGANPLAKSEAEAELFKEVQGWQEFPIMAFTQN